MKKRNLISLIFASFGMMVLIFDGKTAVLGIQSGIEICLRTLIPSLFPFFILSGLATASVTGMSIKPLRILGRICQIPKGSESLLAVGLIGGYPVGAKNISDWYRQRRFGIYDAQRMAVFCNNAGPSFIFGILGPQFPDSRWVWALWLIQIAGSFFTGMLLPKGTQNRCDILLQNDSNITDVLNRSLKSMALVCGWVTLFRMIMEFLNRWIFWMFPVPVQVLLTGMLELSNGCILLSGIPEALHRFVLASVMLSAGGVCILLQTKSVFPDLNMKYYLSGKFLQCLINITLTAAAIPILCKNEVHVPLEITVTSLLIMILTAVITRKRKKEVAIV